MELGRHVPRTDDGSGFRLMAKWKLKEDARVTRPGDGAMKQVCAVEPDGLLLRKIVRDGNGLVVRSSFNNG